MQSKGEESKSSQIQAKSTEVWETELSCGAWVVLKCVSVHLNSLPQCLKKCTVFFPFLYSVSLELLSVRSLKGTFFPGVLLQLHMLIFPSCGAWQWWLCPLRCSGLSGAPQRGRPSGHLRSSPRPTPNGWADPTALSTHKYRHSSRKSITQKCWHQPGRKQYGVIANGGSVRVSMWWEHSSCPAPTTLSMEVLANEKWKCRRLWLSCFK